MCSMCIFNLFMSFVDNISVIKSEYIICLWFLALFQGTPAPSVLVVVIDTILGVNNREPVIEDKPVPVERLKGLVNSFLGCRRVPCEDGSILVVSKKALFTREGCRKGLVVGVDNPAWGSYFTHVEERIPSRVHGGSWLHPCTRSGTQLLRAWVGSGEVNADVVDSLWKGAILVAVACVFLCCVRHGFYYYYYYYYYYYCHYYYNYDDYYYDYSLLPLTAT